MSYKLVIAEKPSVGREIAKVLGANNQKSGYFEGNGYLVSWAIGHLVELAEPQHYDEKLKEWSMSTLPFIPEKFKYQINKTSVQQFNLLKSLINKPEVISLITATDAGREGQLIAELIYLACNCKKPIERLWISSLTEKDIRDGFNNLKPNSYYDGLTQAAHCRQKSDWTIGINASRCFTLKANNGGRYSLGRVQTPTLALIVNREEEITNFVPKQYYQVLGRFNSSNSPSNSNGDNSSYSGIWTSSDGKINRLDKQEEANRIVSKVQGQKGIIDKLEKKLVKEKPPLLFDLTSLQRAANTKYGLTANQTLDIAQSLYEMQVLSYPRTSSQHLSTNLAKEIKNNLNACNIAPYKPFVAQILSSAIKLTSRHINDAKITDHHAIIPTTKSIDINTLDDKQKKVYDLVVRRFLSMFYPEAEIEHTTVTTKVLDEIFITKGKVIIKPGWQVVEDVSNSKDPKEAKDAKDETTKAEADEQEQALPQLEEKQPVKTTKAEVLSKWTKPPSRYTDASLLGAMECAGKEIEDEKLRQAMKDCGLGTPATRASIIELLLKKDYVLREKKTLKPTAKGISLIKLLPCELLKSAELTANWEQKLNQMEKGNYSSATFLAEISSMIKGVVKEICEADITSKLEEMLKDSGEILPCPKCLMEKRQGVLVQKKGQYGAFLACSSSRDVCGYISNVPKTVKQQKALLSSKCPNCAGAMKLYLPKEKEKSPALFCIREDCKGALWFDDKGNVKAPSASSNDNGNSNGNGNSGNAKATQETGKPCVKCGTPTVKRSFVSKTGKKGQFWGCSNWKKEGGCDAEPIWIR